MKKKTVCYCTFVNSTSKRNLYINKELLVIFFTQIVQRIYSRKYVDS